MASAKVAVVPMALAAPISRQSVAPRRAVRARVGFRQ